MKIHTECFLILIAALVLQPSARADAPPALDWIRPSQDKTHFVLKNTNERMVMWGVNYDHDSDGRLLEDYWADEWPTVVEDFHEIKALGANVVRVHLQTGRFLKEADQPDDANLARLAKLVKLAEETGLYLDVTGLGCYHKQDVPKWYDALSESDRWDAQCVFWKAVANVCKDSPAVFCYDLMNEPVVAGGENKTDWLVGKPLGGKYFVQRITNNADGRPDREIAKAWIERLTTAIRTVDDRHMITVGVIPWAQVFKGARPLFHAPDVGGTLDFVSVHLYPKKDQLEADLDALKVYEVGKPLVIEEIFPLSAGFEQTERFIERSREHVDGWISFYWGKTIEEYDEKKGDMSAAITSAWLKRFRDLAPSAASPAPKAKSGRGPSAD
jgi:hypothetical protein